jgi:hypothetical protein
MGGPGQDAQVTLEGFDAQGIGYMAFSNAGWAAQQDILVARDKGASRQVLDKGTIDAWCRREVKVSQGLVAVTAGLRQATSQASLATTFQFIIQEQGQKLGGTELALDGLGGSEVEAVHHARQSELAQFG